MFTLDHANDGDDVKDKSSLEALILRMWAANPNTRIILITSPSWNGVNTGINANVHLPANLAAINNVIALAAYYGITLIDYWQWCRDVVDAGTYTLVQLTADSVHPTTLGYNNMALLLEIYLPTGGTSKPITLPTRLYDNGGYENAPTVKLGTSYDSKSGVWSEIGTRIESSEVGAIVTYSATCTSYGCYRATAGDNLVDISIDGGPFLSGTFYQNGRPISGGRGLHTIAVRVASGTVRIDEAWFV